jgi:hypothetical protein
MMLMAIGVLVLTCLFIPQPAQAAPSGPAGCGLNAKQWWNDPKGCLKQTPGGQLAHQECLQAPVPDLPQGGVGGWLVGDKAPVTSGARGLYSTYGYGGYNFSTYDLGCAKLGAVNAATHPEESLGNSIGNFGMQGAVLLVGASNSLRDHAWNPNSTWGWADSLVSTATRALYHQVFTVWGAIGIGVVGVYLIWRARHANMSKALTVAGWAVLVMVVVTAVAQWPLTSAHVADSALTQGLTVVHTALTPKADQDTAFCMPIFGNDCTDHRSAAVKVADQSTEHVLYESWLRGEFGDPDSSTARTYGRALYDANTLTWSEYQTIKKHPDQADKIVAAHQKEWQQVAAQVKKDDPVAYQYLEGERPWSRAGAGVIALIEAFGFAFFDIAASLLVLLAFMVFRWTVIALPIIGTIGIFQPANGGFRRVVNMAAASVINVLVFGAGGAAYLDAASMIMRSKMPGWMQALMLWLCGVVGWLLLRPYRQITRLGGKNPLAEMGNIGSWHKRVFKDLKTVALGAVGSYLGDVKALDDHDKKVQQQNTYVPPRPEDQPPTEDGPIRGTAWVTTNAPGVSNQPAAGPRRAALPSTPAATAGSTSGTADPRAESGGGPGRYEQRPGGPAGADNGSSAQRQTQRDRFAEGDVIDLEPDQDGIWRPEASQYPDPPTSQKGK